MSKDYHKAWGGNWYRGGANWLENWLNNTLDKDEEHDDRVMMRDAMTKLNQAADEIDRLYQIEKERDFLISEYERAVKCGPQGFAHAAGHIYNAIVNAQCDVNTEHFIEMRNQRDAALEREQALAAHIERIKAEECRAYAGGLSMPGILHSIIHQYPTTSLARRDAQIKANELKRFIGIYLTPGLAHNRATGELQSLQKQAEAPNDRPS